MDFSLDRFPVDIVLFALVALFLVLRLRSVLGRNVGVQATPQQPGPSPLSRQPTIIEGKPLPQSPTTSMDIPAPETRVGQLLTQIATLERGFEPVGFLRGAEQAFRQIIEAFASGNRAVLREQLTADAFAAFDAAITAREQAEETQRTEIRNIQTMSILDAQIVDKPIGTAAMIEVKFVSDQVSLVTGKDGQPVSGVDAVTEFSDLWVFERLLGASISGASWRLVSARTA